MVTKTIGTGSGIGTPDYSSVQAWWDSLATTAVADQVGDFLWATSANELPSSAEILLDGITAGAFTTTLRAADGDSICDTVGALRYDATRGACLTSSTTDDALEINNSGVIFERLMLKKTGSYSSGLRISGGSNVIVRNVVVYTTGANGDAIVRLAPGGAIAFSNFVFYSTAAQGTAGLWNALGNNTFYNGIVAKLGSAASTGVKRDHDTPIFKNVASFGWTTDFSGTVSASSANNATDKSSFGGTNYGGSGQVSLVVGTEFENTTSGSEDFRIKTGSVKLKDNGTATSVPATDFFSQARSGATDIGAFEFQAGGATVTKTTTLSAAVQQARTVAASLSAAVRSTRTVTTTIGAAVQATQSAATSIQTAVQATRTTTATLNAGVQDTATKTTALDSAVAVTGAKTATLDTAVQATQIQTASLNAAIQAALSASTSLTTAVQAAQTASTVIDAYVQGGVQAFTSLDAAIQYARLAAVSLDTAVEISQATASTIDVAVEEVKSASAFLSTAVQVAQSATSVLSAAIQSELFAACQIDAAVQLTNAKTLNLDSAISTGRTLTAVLDAYVSLGGTNITAFMDAVISINRTLSTVFDAYIALSPPSTGFEVAARQSMSVGARDGFIVPVRGTNTVH